jgi:hypothetical protein
MSEKVSSAVEEDKQIGERTQGKDRQNEEREKGE